MPITRMCGGGCGRRVSYNPARGSLTLPVCRYCRHRLRERTCEQCGEKFYPQRAPRPDAPQRFCTAACRIAARTLYADPRAGSKASTRVRRAQRSLTFDGVTDPQILERDGWACQIPGCGEPIPRDQLWPHPRSATVDHIVPLSLGGTDTAPNKRAAHLVCNTRRGNQMHPDDVQVVTPELAPLGVLPASRLAKVVKYCAKCGTAPVKRSGMACETCRDAGRAERRRQILACRADGMRWAGIAARFGLSGPGAAYNIAYPDGSAAPSRRPAPDLDERLWWTTVRPLT